MLALSQQRLELGVVVGEEGDQPVGADQVELGQVQARLLHCSLSRLDDVDEAKMMVSVHVTDVDTLETQEDVLRSLKEATVITKPEPGDD